MDSSSSFQRFASASALETYLIDNALERYANLFGQAAYDYWYWPPVFSERDGIAIDVLPESVALPTAAVDFTGASDTTNVQVDGVDEADLIETDGEFLYQVSGQTVTVVDAKDPSALAIASQFSLEPLSLPSQFEAPSSQNTAHSTVFPVEPFFPIGGPVGGWSQIDGMYLQGDRLTVIASGYSPQPLAESNARFDALSYYPSNPQVQVTVLDVADPTQVSLLETSVLEGSLVSSRSIGDEVVVVTSQGFQLPAPQIIRSGSPSVFPEPIVVDIDVAPVIDNPVIDDPVIDDPVIDDPVIDLDEPVIDSALPYYPDPSGTYETQAAYLERIEGQVLAVGLPNVVTFDRQGTVVSSGVLTEPTDIYKPFDPSPWQQLTTVSTFDVADDHLGVDASVSLPTKGVNEVFVSQNYLYLLQQRYRPETFGPGSYQTEILQFDLETSTLVATGAVPGRIDNQFSVDEYNGHLRISTTTNFGAASRNNVYVLEQNQDSLDVIGKIEGLAPGERIFSTRFQGDYGFVVTFRQVDPLFALDLSDPTQPRVAGELKIPGFSEYLQVIQQGEQTLLLGVGRDADPVTGIAGALKVSLFDVTNLANPIEIDNYIFEGAYTFSEALWDHKAITYVPDQKLLAIPTQEYNGNFYRSQTRLTVLNVDGEAGLTSLGKVDHEGDWINRSVAIREALFAVSSQQISAYDLGSLEDLEGDLEPLSEVAWGGAKVEPLGFDPLPVDPLANPFVSPGFFEAERSGVTIAANPMAEALSGSQQDDAIDGGAGNDRLYSNGGQDVFFGGAGNDQIYGGNDSDIAFAGTGDDVVYGNEARDILLGNEGKDQILAGGGDDVLVGGLGNDQLTGGSGADLFIYREGDGLDVIEDFQLGRDRIGLVDLEFKDLGIKQDGLDTLVGSTANQGDSHQPWLRLKYVQASQLDDSSNFVSTSDVLTVSQALSLLA